MPERIFGSKVSDNEICRAKKKILTYISNPKSKKCVLGYLQCLSFKDWIFISM